MGIGMLPASAAGPSIATRTTSVQSVSDDSMISAAYRAFQAQRPAEYATSASAVGATNVPDVNAETGFNLNEAIGFVPTPGSSGVSIPDVNAATGFNLNEAIGFTLAPGRVVVTTPNVSIATGFNLNEATGFTPPAPGRVGVTTPNVNAATGFTLP
jgi:hypothetical protein